MTLKEAKRELVKFVKLKTTQQPAFVEVLLNAIPAADVVEVRPGQWIYNNMGGWKCSECNNQAPFWCMASTQNLSDYCPNCGAKMDKEVE